LRYTDLAFVADLDIVNFTFIDLKLVDRIGKTQVRQG